ncbi:MAG: TolC family protein [Gemmatimonadota bacterium]|nr:MAG: TolC family protein [Gemmatimonadota bacterium]
MPRSLTSTAAAAALLLALAAASPASGQTDPRMPGQRAMRALSLDQAIAEALAGNARLAIAEARGEIAGSRSRSASSPLWPRLEAQAGYTRSVDPVFAFGTKLRQGRFEEPDFALDALNNPEPIGDWSTVVGVRWSLLDPTLWAGRSAARRQAEAADWSTIRTREATVLLIRTAYHRAQMTEAQQAAAAADKEAAEANLERFRRRRDRGLLTEADYLQAVAEVAAAEARLTEAERVRIDALQDLGHHLGWGPDTLPEPSDELSLPAELGEVEFDPEARADLRARAAAAEASGAAKTQATLSYVPAVDAFAQYATHSEDPLSFDQDNWTVGVMLRWTLFDGFGRAADLQRANLERRIAQIEYAQALRDARSELSEADRGVRSAERQVQATQAARAAAESGRDLMRRRFEEGLATAADLLQAEARATDMRQRAITALAGYHTAVAHLEFVQSQSNVEN